MSVKIGDKTRSVVKRDSKIMINTTRESYPFVPDHGDGDFVYDIEGNRFIDFSTFISVYNIGVNANKEVRDAAKKQIDLLMHSAFTDYYNEKPVAFAEKLVDFMPKGFGRVFFSNSGTEANEAAIKFAKLFTGRSHIIAFYGAFHGRTGGSLGLTASKAIQREHFGPFPNVVHAPYAYCYRCPLKLEYPSCGIACADVIKEEILSKAVPKNEVAAIFMEPIQGEGGYVVPPKEFVRKIRKTADDIGALLVADEVQSGYMRTGKFLAMDNFGVDADIYTMAKSLGGGLPFAATVARSSLGNIPKGAHANTFGGNLVAVAAANASLEYLKRNMKSLTSGIMKRSSYMIRRLNEMKDRYDIIGDVRGIGLMIGVEFVKDKKTKEPAAEKVEKILLECFNKGLLLLPAGMSTIRIIPALNAEMDNIEKGLDIFEEAVAKIGRD